MAFSVKWIFELSQDYPVDLGPYLAQPVPQTLSFRCRGNVERLVLFPDGRAIVRAGYAWDGCTPKFALLDLVLGIPDGVPNEKTRKPKTYYASLVHDVLYQFLDVDLPIDRRGADRAFRDLMRRDAFLLGGVYWAFVRLFGWLFRRYTRWKRSYAGRCVVIPTPAPGERSWH